MSARRNPPCRPSPESRSSSSATPTPDKPEHPAEGEVKWLSFVTDYLKPAIKSGAIDLWFDRLMPGGVGWEPEIEKKFRACDIFILLVSRHSLSSNYVVDNEIPIIRERQRKGEAVHFYPIVLTPTPKAGLRLVSDKNLRPRDGKPLSDYPLHEWYRHMAEAADEIADLAAKIAARKRLSRRPPPSAEAWEVSPPSADLLGGDARPKDLRIDDRKSLQSWLKEQSREISTTIAVRAALRALPLAFGAAPRRPGRTRSCQFGAFISAVFRANSLARVATRYPSHADELPPFAEAVAVATRALDSAATAGVTAAGSVSQAVVDPAAAADAAAVAAAIAGATATFVAGEKSAVIAPAAIAASAAADAGHAWMEIRADVAAVNTLSASALSDLPLWSRDVPGWAKNAWNDLKAALPESEDWEVWIDWYEDRLCGGSRGESHELIFAVVPEEIWDKGPAVANLRIRDRLPRRNDDPYIEDQRSLRAWLSNQGREVSDVLAVRAALRVLPLLDLTDGDINEDVPIDDLGRCRNSLFQHNALSWLAARFRYQFGLKEIRSAPESTRCFACDQQFPGNAGQLIGQRHGD